MKIAGICGIVAVVSMGLFCIFSGLHCAMQVNNKHIGLKYKKNVFLAFISAIVAGKSIGLRGRGGSSQKDLVSTDLFNGVIVIGQI